MAKIISVADDVYENLSKIKGKDSYSVLIRKFLIKGNNTEEFLKFAGKVNIDERKVNELKKGWKKWSEKYA